MGVLNACKVAYPVKMLLCVGFVIRLITGSPLIVANASAGRDMPFMMYLA
jgi:hypothetical protein